MRIALLLLLITAPLAAAAPPPKGADKKPVLYFPTTVGDKAVYEVTTAGQKSERATTVTKVEEKDGVFRVTTEDEAVAARPALATTHAVSEKGVSALARGTGKELKDLTAPQPLLKLPAKKGDTWDHDPAPPNRPAGLPSLATTYTVGAEEEVETPAGKFKAVPVEGKRAAVGHFAATVWYAPGVGVVKTVSSFAGVERTTVLKSFTPGK